MPNEALRSAIPNGNPPSGDNPVASFLLEMAKRLALGQGNPNRQQAPTGPSIGSSPFSLLQLVPLQVRKSLEGGPAGGLAAILEHVANASPGEFAGIPPEGKAATNVAQGAEKVSIRRRIADFIDPSRQKELTEAFTDKMSGLSNQTAFGRALPRMTADKGSRFVTFDLTNFKAINDRISREAGDARIAEFGKILREVAERHGIEARNLFRAGGDEFVAVGSDSKKLEELAQEVSSRFPEMKAGEFTSGVRYGVGSTFSEADAAAQAKKEAEAATRYRHE